jgi:hypothetical protein
MYKRRGVTCLKISTMNFFNDLLIKSKLPESVTELRKPGHKLDEI